MVSNPRGRERAPGTSKRLDSSVMPILTTSSAFFPTAMMAEKASDLIAPGRAAGSWGRFDEHQSAPALAAWIRSFLKRSVPWPMRRG